MIKQEIKFKETTDGYEIEYGEGYAVIERDGIKILFNEMDFIIYLKSINSKDEQTFRTDIGEFDLKAYVMIMQEAEDIFNYHLDKFLEEHTDKTPFWSYSEKNKYIQDYSEKVSISIDLDELEEYLIETDPEGVNYCYEDGGFNIFTYMDTTENAGEELVNRVIEKLKR